MRHLTKSILALILAIVLATSAFAATVGELQSRANDLNATCGSLLSRAEACPGGTCPDGAAIRSEFAAAETSRLELKADRETLNPCTTCSTLDETISTVDARAATMRGILDGWDGKG